MPAAKHVLLAVLAVLLADARGNGTDQDDVVGHRRNDRAPQGGSVPGRAEGRGDQYELISTSSNSAKDKVASADLPAADKQYDYPLVRPVYAPFVTRPSVPAYAVPFVEILDHHRDPPFDVGDQHQHHRDPPFVTTQKPPPGHYVGAPMVSTVVVQDLSQTPPRPAPTPVGIVEHDGVITAVHHLNPTKIPFTDVKVVTKPVGAKPKPGVKPAAARPARPPNFTDKLEETSLENSGAASAEDDPLLENPPNLDMSGIVEEVVKKVFRENQVLHDASALLPPAAPGGLKSWPCPPVTCCSKAAAGHATKCSTFIKCVSGRQCPARRVPQALALSKPSNGYANATDPEADVRDGEPRFKKKKILKKKKKLLKKFLLPLLLAYKLLFLLIVPLLVNGMMMMMSSSGMAGFFFALIGASVTMVRLYSGATRPLPPPPPPNKVVKVIKYVQTTPMPTPSPSPPPTIPAPTPTIIHHQPSFVDEHFPSYHPPPSFHHSPSYGSYYPHPYWNRHYDRNGGGGGALDGGRKRRRRIDDTDTTLNLWLV